jgi:hypothetical protein
MPEDSNVKKEENSQSSRVARPGNWHRTDCAQVVEANLSHH